MLYYSITIERLSIYRKKKTMQDKYRTVMTFEIFESLVMNFMNPGEEEKVVARWQSLDGIEYFGLSINPERPSVVSRFVELPPEMGGGLEFSTFWVVQEEGNPYSVGNSLADQRVEILLNGHPMSVHWWHIDQTWVPISLAELMKQRGW
jgi:hypothetical protein